MDLDLENIDDENSTSFFVVRSSMRQELRVTTMCCSFAFWVWIYHGNIFQMITVDHQLTFV